MKNLRALLGTAFFAGAIFLISQEPSSQKIFLPTYNTEIQKPLSSLDNSTNEYNLPVEEVKSRKFPLLYQVQKGDTWSELAEKYNFPLKETMKKNGYDMGNACNLRAGEIVDLN